MLIHEIVYLLLENLFGRLFQFLVVENINNCLISVIRTLLLIENKCDLIFFIKGEVSKQCDWSCCHNKPTSV
jgi:hypothetical protein